VFAELLAWAVAQEWRADIENRPAQAGEGSAA
jgi:hypothetical protein